MGIVADDLPRIELVLRVEGIFDLAEDLDQLAVLFAQKLRARQAAAPRARDRPAGLDDDVVNPGGKRFQLGPIAGIGQIEKRPQSQPAFAGVRVDGPCDVLLLEHALQSRQDRGQPVGGDRDVVDERDGPRPAAKPHQERFQQTPQAEQPLAFRPLDG